MHGWSANGRTAVDRVDAVWVVELTGEHDLSTAVELNAVLDSLLARGQQPLTRPTRVVIDLSRTTFIDSTVIAALLRVHDQARIDPEIRLAIAVESPDCPIGRTLRLVGVTRALPTYADRGEAVAAVAGRPESLALADG